MSALEKQKILSAITDARSPKSLINKEFLSPYFKTLSFYLSGKKHTVYYAMASLLIFMLGGSGLAIASLGSIPGNTLYPLKVKVVEPVRAALNFSPEDRAFYASARASERLIEAEILIAEKRLDEKKKKQIGGLIKSHTRDLNSALSEIKKRDKEEKTDEIIRGNFEDEIVSHKDAMRDIGLRLRDKKEGKNENNKNPNLRKRLDKEE